MTIRLALATLILLGTTSLTYSQETITRCKDFEVRFNSGVEVDFNDLGDLYGIYNLVENQRYANQAADYYGDSGIRGAANAQLAFGLANLVLGQLQRAASRPPTPKPARVRFELTLWREDLNNQNQGLEVLVRVHNTGWHELSFAELERHLYLLDQDGYPIALAESEESLDLTLAPGEATEGYVWFPRIPSTSHLRFSFQEILGESGELEFRP